MPLKTEFWDAAHLSGFNGLRLVGNNGLVSRLCEQGRLIGSISEEFLLALQETHKFVASEN